MRTKEEILEQIRYLSTVKRITPSIRRLWNRVKNAWNRTTELARTYTGPYVKVKVAKRKPNPLKNTVDPTTGKIVKHKDLIERGLLKPVKPKSKPRQRIVHARRNKSSVDFQAENLKEMKKAGYTNRATSRKKAKKLEYKKFNAKHQMKPDGPNCKQRRERKRNESKRANSKLSK